MKVSMHLGKKLSVRHNLRDYEEGKWNRDGHIKRNLSYKNAVTNERTSVFTGVLFT